MGSFQGLHIISHPIKIAFLQAVVRICSSGFNGTLLGLHRYVCMHAEHPSLCARLQAAAYKHGSRVHVVVCVECSCFFFGENCILSSVGVGVNVWL